MRVGSAHGMSASTLPAGRHDWAPLLLGIVVGLVLAVLIAVLVVLPWALTHHQSGGLEQEYGNAVVNAVSAVQGKQAPAAASSQAMQQARANYLTSCAECHGADGRGSGEFGASTFPPATDLTSSQAKEKSDAQLLWIVKNGLGFTSMPGYGRQYNDQQAGALVSYVRALQEGKG